MSGPTNAVWTSSFLRINEEGKLVGRHLDFFGSTDLLRSKGLHMPNASSLEDIRISDAPETELGVTLYDLLSREAAYNTIFIYQSIWLNLM